MKYSGVTCGQVEALLNVVGGVFGLQSILQGKRTLEEVVGGREVACQLQFLKELPKILALRDFLRGWGEYDDNMFTVELHHFTDKALNICLRCLEKGDSLNPEIAREFILQVSGLQQKVIAFEAVSGNRGLGQVGGMLGLAFEILVQLDKGTPLSLLRLATRLHGYFDAVQDNIDRINKDLEGWL